MAPHRVFVADTPTALKSRRRTGRQRARRDRRPVRFAIHEYAQIGVRDCFLDSALAHILGDEVLNRLNVEWFAHESISYVIDRPQNAGTH